jgi:hypothetical protein
MITRRPLSGHRWILCKGCRWDEETGEEGVVVVVVVGGGVGVEEG